VRKASTIGIAVVLLLLAFWLVLQGLTFPGLACGAMSALLFLETFPGPPSHA
jgi:hypothetical protein